MKNFFAPLIIFLSIILITGCRNRTSVKDDSATLAESAVPDTGYTGITQGMSGKYMVNEVTYKNGVKQGLMKTFYLSGRLRQTFWYENGIRQDSSVWFYEEGQVFRITPYKNDTIDGIQKQYYRTGELKAKLLYKKGLRVPYLEEFTREGKLIGGYPQLIVNTVDKYKSNGIYIINASLSDKSTKVRFYRGDFSKGVFDTAHCEKINITNGIGKLVLKKTNTQTSDSVGIVAEILTGFGNNYLAYKNINLAYKDLK